MNVAIISDIHANLEAFQAVIDDIEKRHIQEVYCLGDLIGYGPDPDEVVELFVAKGYISVLGNHEAALNQTIMRDWLNFQAKENSLQTEKLLSEKSFAFCTSLPSSIQVHKAHLVHGFPPDSVLGYVTMVDKKGFNEYFKHATCDICFVGHSHDLMVVTYDGSGITRQRMKTKQLDLEPQKRYIINAGSVGQPRDGNNNAKYLIWEREKKRIEIVYIPYDFHTTTEKIKQRGFPEAYGYRLW